MVLKDGAAVRQERLNLLMDLIEHNQDTMTEKKMKGIFMLKTGLTRRKIDEYFIDFSFFSKHQTFSDGSE